MPPFGSSPTRHASLGSARPSGTASQSAEPPPPAFQGIGDFFASPYRIYAPRRINSRLEAATFAARAINAEDVSWEQGLPLTRPERTLIDLCLDSEDPSLIADAYRDARDIGLDYEHLGKLVRETSATPKREKALEALAELMRAIPKGDR